MSSCLLALPAHPNSFKSAAKAVRKARQQTLATSQAGKLAPRTIKARTATTQGNRMNLRVARQTLRVLNQRVQRTFDQALQAQKESPYQPILTGPAKRRAPLYIPSILSAKRMYPDKPFLQHPLLGTKLAEAYFLAQNNRLFINLLREAETFWPKFSQAIPRFYEEAKALKQPENILEWTAQQIPAEVTDLFIGEIHDQHEIPQFISELLPLLRQQNPNRPIFLFTEFLLDTQYANWHVTNILVHTSKGHYYAPVWDAAHQLNIPIIGLESSKVPGMHFVKMADIDGNISVIPAGATPEGLRIRNEHWYKILQEYRKKNPDALFVVYTGSAHSLYNFPFSLAKRFPKKTTRMIDLTLREIREDGEICTKTDNLEILNPTLSFPQPVLTWDSPDLIELSGFDVRIKLEPTPKPRELIEQDMLPLQNFLQWPEM